MRKKENAIKIIDVKAIKRRKCGGTLSFCIITTKPNVNEIIMKIIVVVVSNWK